ncbi:MAG: cupredoxin domain-containing protein [Candidatus Micrarchaeota archaeon]|nr:cupredoxin domain-containing protein [Candidatus Micrarchaeota archaeon]
MTDEIKINKKMFLLILGLLVSLVVGGFLVFGSSSQSTDDKNTVPTGAQVILTAPNAQGVQEIYLKASSGGYDKSEIVVKKGVPVRLHFSAKNAGCGSYMVIYGLKNGLRDVNALSRDGEDSVVDFTPTQEGTYEYNCGMRMFRGGRFVVVA